jgi:6,7-dimethyl-8-ribityllumazine synthase
MGCEWVVSNDEWVVRGMKTIEGSLTPPAGRFAIVAARFNDLIVDRLVQGAHDGLRRHGVAEDAIDLVRVPGSMEIATVARRLAQSGDYAAIICLGAVIRGETDHYDHVAAGAASGINQAGIETGVPVIFGVLTCETLDQAMNRAGGKASNKGFDAAVAAIEMANLMKRLG